MAKLNNDLAAARKTLALQLFMESPKTPYQGVNDVVAAALPGGRMSPNLLVELRRQAIQTVKGRYGNDTQAAVTKAIAKATARVARAAVRVTAPPDANQPAA